MKTNALIAGSTGLVGKELKKLLYSNAYYGSVHLPVRTLPAQQLTEGHHHLVDFAQFEQFDPGEPIHDVYICLGTTQKKAGGRTGFYLVDHDYAYNIATWALKYGAERICLISSIGANPRSGSFYLKTKGRIEQAITNLEFKHTCIVRPSLLLGKREEYRWAEAIASRIYPAFSFMLIGRWKKYRAVQAEKVAQAMFRFTTNAKEKLLIAENDKILEL